MKRKSPATRTELNILKSARTELRSVTTAEKIASKGRFSLGGAYLVPKSITKITTRTAFVSRFKDFAAGVSHGTATALRKASLLPYKGAAAEAQAAAQSATKATPASKIARSRKAKRNARRQSAASKAGIERGAKQRRRTIKFIEEKIAQHERYLKTGRERIDDDEYRRTVHLMYEFFGDDERMDRMKESYTLTAIAAE